MAERNENPHSSTVTLFEVDSKESLNSKNEHGVILSVTNSDKNPSCRICFSGSSKGKLIRPCKCKGTIEHVHRHCLERWLEARNIEVCELCQQQFLTKRSKRSCWEMLSAPEMQSERRNCMGDSTCFAFLTPLVIATLWLCIEGAIYYQEVKNSPLETVALSFLAVFLVIAYFIWIILCTKYHRTMLAQWQNRNLSIRIIDRPSSDQAIFTVPSNPAQNFNDGVEPSVVRYAKGADFVAILSADHQENNTTRQQLDERPACSGWI